MKSHVKRNELEERRTCKRFPLKEWTAIAGLRAKLFTVVGGILDISRSGLSMEYVHNDGDIDVPTEVNICVFNHVFFIKDLPCRSVYAVDAASPEFSMVQTKRCGIEFRELTEKQVSQLEFFLRTYALDVSV